MTSVIDSFLGLFQKCSGSSFEIGPSERLNDWNSLPSLPEELLENILDLVGDPTRTALVNKNFNVHSQHSYTVLLGQYAGYPSLPQLLPLKLQPAQKVQAIYLFILREAKSGGITPQTVEPHLLPLAPERLAKIRELTLPRVRDKFSVYQAVFRQIDSQFCQTFDQMTMQSVIELSEKILESPEKFFSSLPTELDLGSRHLTHLPPHIGLLKGLKNLNLHHNDLTVLPDEIKSLTKLTTLSLNGNPLSPENVKDICQSLPSLETVVVDNEQPCLLEMFQTHFPQLKLWVVQILRIEEAF